MYIGIYLYTIWINHNMLQCLFDLQEVTSRLPLISNVCANVQWYHFQKGLYSALAVNVIYNIINYYTLQALIIIITYLYLIVLKLFS